MFRTALRTVLAHRARLLMTVLAVMLGVTFVSGTLVFTSTVSDGYEKSAERSFDGVDVAVEPGRAAPDAAPGARPGLDRALLDRLAALPAARSATGVVSGFTAVADRHGAAVGTGWADRGANYWPGKDGTDPRYPLSAGRAPRGSGEIALDEGTASRAGYHVGDTVRISVDGPVRRPRLAGVFRTSDGDVAAGGSLVLFDIATAQRLLGTGDEFSEIDVRAAAGTSQTGLAAAVDAVLPPSLRTVTGATLAHEQALRTEESMSSLRTTLLVFAGIALFVGIFLIANTFTMLVAQRTRELALLRAVGATRRQVTRSVLVEAFLVGLVASVVGLAAGIGLGAALRPLAGSFRGGSATLPAGPLSVTAVTVVVSLGVGTCVTVLAAWLPARRAARIAPVAAMGSVHAVATTRSLVLRNTLGALVSAGGAVIVLAATGLNTRDGQLVMALGAAVLLVGVLVLTPLLSRPFVAGVGPLLRRFGVTGRIAGRNALRNPRRTASTASALTIGLTLITGLTVLAVSSQRDIDRRATASLSADYTVRMAGYEPLSETAVSRLRGAPGVRAASPLRDTLVRIGSEDTFITGLDASAAGQLVRPEFDAGSLRSFGGTRVLVAEDTADEHGWRQGSALRVTYPDGRTGTWTVSGVYRGDDLLQGVIADTRTLDPHLTSLGARQVLVRTGGASDRAEHALSAALGDSPAVLVQSKEELSASIEHGVTVTLELLYALLAMAIVVAVLGVVNTLAMSVVERVEEISVLRAVGLDRRGVRRMVSLESVAISLFGGVLGIGLGIFLGWAGCRLLAGGMPGFALVLPWGRLALFLVLAGVTGLLAALWPARRAARVGMTGAA